VSEPASEGQAVESVPRAPSAFSPARIAVVSAILALAYAALIFWISSQSNPFPFLPSGLFAHDKLIHALEYWALGALLRGAFAGTRLGPRGALAAAIVVASLYGATDEWHQLHVPNRGADVRDWIADTAGASAGAVLAAAFLRRRLSRASIRA
jgi:VanZ family protein